MPSTNTSSDNFISKAVRIAGAILEYKKGDHASITQLLDNKALTMDEKRFVLATGLLEFNGKDEDIDTFLDTLNERREVLNSFKGTRELLDSLQSAVVEDNKIISFGYKILDEFIGGIFPTSLVVIGGRSGHGKSKFCGDFAIRTAKQGLKVVYFDLENDEGDFINRELVTRLARRNIFVKKATLRRKSFWEDDERSNTAHLIYGEIMEDLGDNLKVFSGEKLPTFDDFLKYMDALDDVDLVIVDHLHYFSMNEDKQEHQQIAEIMRRIRTFTKTGTPVILASHVRNPQGKEREPNKDDLFGSSNIAKEAETVILPYRMPEQEGKFNTKIIVSKNRINGPEKSFYAIFDKRQNQIVEISDDFITTSEIF